MPSIDDNVAYMHVRGAVSLWAVNFGYIVALPLILKGGHSKSYGIDVSGTHMDGLEYRGADGVSRYRSPDIGGRHPAEFFDTHQNDPVDRFTMQFRSLESGVYVPVAEASGRRYRTGTEVTIAARSPIHFEKLIRHFEDCGGKVISTSH